LYSDTILLEMIQTPKERLENVQKEFFVLGSIGKENASTYNSLRGSISETVKQAQEQYNFVKEYISKSKKERKKCLEPLLGLDFQLNNFDFLKTHLHGSSFAYFRMSYFYPSFVILLNNSFC